MVDTRNIIIQSLSGQDVPLEIGSASDPASAQGAAPGHVILSVPASAFSALNALSTFENNFKPLEYISNYASILSTTLDEFQSRNIKRNNEIQLARYYEFKKPIGNMNPRQNSVGSASDSSVVQSDRNRNINTIIDNFLSFAENDVDPYRLKDTLKRYDDIPSSHSGLRLARMYSENTQPYVAAAEAAAAATAANPTMGQRNSASAPTGPPAASSSSSSPQNSINSLDFANSYYKYYKKLLTVDLKDYDILKKHNLWVPTVRKDHERLLAQFDTQDPTDDSDIYRDKTCPLFITGSYDLPSLYDFQAGHSVLPSVFSEYKLPSLMYHTAIEFNRQVYILGGLMACYRNDEEMPDLENYYVDGIKNLPPPLLQDVVNNPAMVNNPYLYIQSTNSSRLSRPAISGQIPPPLICMTASKLTDRYLAFYGGIEIKTESNFDQSGKIFIKKRAFLNNTVYILDTVSFKFTKIEVSTQSFKDGRSPTFAPRFGHMQLAIRCSDLAHTGQDNYPDSASSVGTSDTGNMHKSDSSYSEGTVVGGAGNGPAGANINPTTGRQDSPGVGTPLEPNSKMMTQTSLQWVNSNSSGTNMPYGVNGGHGSSSICSILIYGGYRQTVDDKYRAMDDMWRLDVGIVARGKKGYLKFAESINATNIQMVGEESHTPAPRAFFASCIPDVALSGKSSLEDVLLKRLDDNFNVESNLFESGDGPLFTSADGAGATAEENTGANANTSTTASTPQQPNTFHHRGTSLFPNIPHGSGSHIPISKVITNSSAATGGSGSGSRSNTNSNGARPSAGFQPTNSHISEGADRQSISNESVISASQLPLSRTQVMRGLESANALDQGIGSNTNLHNSSSNPLDSLMACSDRGRIIVVHGGSDGIHVYGDMWWFDLDTLRWLEVPTYTRRDLGVRTELAENQLKLVGHSLVSSGYTGIFLGGMEEDSVNVLYSGEDKDRRGLSIAGGGLLNMINLKTQCLVCDADKRRLEKRIQGSQGPMPESPHSADRQALMKSMCSVGGTTVESEGTVLLVGGLVYSKQRIDRMYLRGAILEFILPAMSLPM
ncbi:Gpb1 protein [Maudiozyma humilis]|uniref:Gpb1 protein n=1 Tax=Maudiozyma humilis TaxID=51915 RepID=A0AAV5RZT0_MAUHU|nr:Gpb1 protein [Kazachstania humilis]